MTLTVTSYLRLLIWYNCDRAINSILFVISLPIMLILVYCSLVYSSQMFSGWNKTHISMDVLFCKPVSSSLSVSTHGWLMLDTVDTYYAVYEQYYMTTALAVCMVHIYEAYPNGVTTNVK